ncbi:MAG: recombination protein NinG, partial [Candidatus Roizmanbacteria bacterium]
YNYYQLRILCEICGNPARGKRCWQHKTKKPIARTALKRKPKSAKKPPKEKTGGKRVRSVRTLKGILWSWVSKYVRLRDSDENGFGKCITCDNIEYWKYADAGHFRPRKHTSTFVHEKNLSSQCKSCNQIKGGREKEHGEALDNKWGEGTAEMLIKLSHEPKRFNQEELEELIEHYKAEVVKLLKTKNR